MVDPLYNYRARVLRVVDGDTIDLQFDLGFGVKFNDRVRLARVDSWELRRPERERGLAAKAFVSRFLTPADFVVVSTERGKGKYGRWIAEVWVPPDFVNLSDLLVSRGHAEYV